MSITDGYVVANFLGLLTPNIAELEKLTRPEFKRLYLEEMTDFMRNHIEFMNNPIKPNQNRGVECWNCFEQVKSPADLVRYFGRNLHNNCFREEYSKERSGLREKEQRYFDLIKKVRR